MHFEQIHAPLLILKDEYIQVHSTSVFPQLCVLIFFNTLSIPNCATLRVETSIKVW